MLRRYSDCAYRASPRVTSLTGRRAFPRLRYINICCFLTQHSGDITRFSLVCSSMFPAFPSALTQRQRMKHLTDALPHHLQCPCILNLRYPADGELKRHAWATWAWKELNRHGRRHGRTRLARTPLPRRLPGRETGRVVRHLLRGAAGDDGTLNGRQTPSRTYLCAAALGDRGRDGRASCRSIS